MHFLGRTILCMGLMTGVAFCEQSVYGNTNGFYNTDKVLVKNKKLISVLQRKILEQNERIDGIMSIVEGLSATVNELKNTQASSQIPSTSNNVALLEELGVMIDKINTTYVSKDELQKALGNGVSTQAPVVPVAKPVSKPKDILNHKNTKELYSEGVRLFVKKRYDEAKKRFEITDTKGHKPAASNYYLGEIAYYTKKYSDAVFYFKKSAGLDDKASYIDTLLLHTAISLEKNGETKQARAFYENIIENYEGKKTASIAKDKLKKL